MPQGLGWQMHPLVPHQVWQTTASLSLHWQWPQWNLLCWQHQVMLAPRNLTELKCLLPLSTCIPLVKAQKLWIPPLQGLVKSLRKTALLRVLLKLLQPARPLWALQLLWLLPNQPLFLCQVAQLGWGHHLQQQVTCLVALISGGARNQGTRNTWVPLQGFLKGYVCMYDKSVVSRVWG